MFAKLKKKIEEENQGELNIGIPAALSGPTPTHSRSASESSPTVTPPKVVPTTHASSSSKTENVQNASKKQSPQSNKPNVSDLAQQTKEKAKQEQIAKQIIDHSRKEAEKIESSRKVQQLEKEKLELERKLVETESRLEKMIEKQENKEELESFQNQEIAKVKHLLLCSQQDIRKMEEKFQSKAEECQVAQEKVCELQKSLEQLQDSKEHHNKEQNKIKELQKEKASLEKEIDRLKQETLQNSGRFIHMETTLSNLTDEYDGLKHTHEIYKNKTTSMLDEKDAKISNLEDKVMTLEKRLSDSPLTGDDKVNSLVAERDLLEKKLDETRQHLNEIKSSWSEKINSLESQIFNLNQKMAEDEEECTNLDKRLQATLNNLKLKEAECWKLEEDLQIKSKELLSLKSEKDEEIRKLHALHSSQLEELRSQTAQLRADLNHSQREREKETQEAQSKLNDLMTTQTEFVEKEIETEKQITGLENSIRHSKTELSKKEKENSSLQQSLKQVQEQLQESQQKVEELHKELEDLKSSDSSLRQTVKENETEVHALSQEINELKLRNAFLSNENSQLRQDMRECQGQGEEEKKELETEIQNLKSVQQEMNSKMSLLESQASENNDSSVNLLEVMNKVIDLEAQLAEKTKTIKLQQQRINDMKKTLQRELRFQPANDGLHVSDNVEGNSLSAAGDVRQCSNAGQPRDGTRQVNHGENIREEDINFKYLKHVVFKFMTSKEYEAQHLIRAVSVLLHFTPEEERIIRDTLEWKSSWFGGSRPQLTKGSIKSTSVL